jgi:hypothetical protein
MKKLVIILTFTLVVLGLHCFALHKRVAYFENDIASARVLLADISRSLFGFDVNAAQTNKVQYTFEKEVAP